MNAAFLGMGALTNGFVGLNLTGTSEHLGCVGPCVHVAREAYLGVNRVLFLDDREAFYGVTSSGGQAVEWFVKDLMGAKDVHDYFNKLFENQDEIPLASNDNLLFLPYIEGERNPWNNPEVRGVFFGLSRSHRQIYLAVAVLEGVCFALRAIYDQLPVKPEQMIVSGGASTDDLWNQMKANVMNAPFVKLNTTEAGCTGAAILALSILHLGMSFKEGTAKIVRPIQTYRPDADRCARYEKNISSFWRCIITWKSRCLT